MFNKDGTLKKKHKIKIEEFMKDIKCRKDFLCYNKNLDELCEATIGGNWEYLRCDESPSVHCDYILHVGDSRICQCPIQKYIALQMSPELTHFVI